MSLFLSLDLHLSLENRGLDHSKAVLLLWIFFILCLFLLYCLVGLCDAVLLSPAGKRADVLALLCVMFSCVFVTFPYGNLGQVWYLIVSIPDLCLIPYYGYS